MSDLDLKAIRERAMTATPGPWYSAAYSEPRQYHRWLLGSRSNLADELSPDNAAHIAGMDPPTTLALVDEVERLRRELSDVSRNRDAMARGEATALEMMAGERSRAHAAEAEAAKLRARVAELEGALGPFSEFVTDHPRASNAFSYDDWLNKMRHSVNWTDFDRAGRVLAETRVGDAPKSPL